MALDPGFRPPLFYALSCPVGQEALPAGGAGLPGLPIRGVVMEGR